MYNRMARSLWLIGILLGVCLSTVDCSQEPLLDRVTRVLQSTGTISAADFKSMPEIEAQCEAEGNVVDKFTLSADKRKELRGGISAGYPESLSIWQSNSFKNPGQNWFDESKSADVASKSNYYSAGFIMIIVVGVLILCLAVCVIVNLFRKEQMFNTFLTKIQKNRYVRHSVFALTILSLLAICGWIYLWVSTTDFSVMRMRIRQINCAVIALKQESVFHQQLTQGGSSSTAGLSLLKMMSDEISSAMASIDAAKAKTAQMRSSDILNRWEDTSAAYASFKSSYTADSKTYQGSIDPTVQVKSEYLIKLKSIIEKDLPEEISYFQFITSRIWGSTFTLEDFDSSKQSKVNQTFSSISTKASKVTEFVQTMYSQYFTVGDYLTVIDQLQHYYIDIVVSVLTLCFWQFFIVLVTGYFSSCRILVAHCAKLNLVAFGAVCFVCTLLIRNMSYATTGAFFACDVMDKLQTEKGAFKSIFGSYVTDADSISAYFDTCVQQDGSQDLLKGWGSQANLADVSTFSKMMEGVQIYTTVLPMITEYPEYTVGGGIDRNLTFHSKFKLLDKGIPANQDYREAMEQFNTFRCALEVMNYNTSMCIYNTTLSFSTDDDQYDKRIGREYCMAYGAMPFTHCYANRYKNRVVSCINGTPDEAGPLITSGCKSAKSFSEMMVQVRSDPAMDSYLTKNGWAFKSLVDPNFKSAYESLVKLFPTTASYLSKSQSQLEKSLKCSNVIKAFRALENTVCFRSLTLVQEQISRMQMLMILCVVAAIFTLLSERMINTSFDETFGHEKDALKALNKDREFQKVPREEPEQNYEIEKWPAQGQDNQLEMNEMKQEDPDVKYQDGPGSNLNRDKVDHVIIPVMQSGPGTTQNPDHSNQDPAIAAKSHNGMMQNPDDFANAAPNHE